jgi:acyl-CoA thioester hydrolase
MTRPDGRIWIDVEVRFRDCDPMGHVNNAVYLTYLEEARKRYWREVLGIADYRQVDFILARAEIDFRAPAFPGQVLRVWIRAGELRRSSFDFHYEIRDAATDALVAEARTVQVMYDYARQRPKPIPDAVRDRIRAFEAGLSPAGRP